MTTRDEILDVVSTRRRKAPHTSPVIVWGLPGSPAVTSPQLLFAAGGGWSHGVHDGLDQTSLLRRSPPSKGVEATGVGECGMDVIRQRYVVRISGGQTAGNDIARSRAGAPLKCCADVHEGVRKDIGMVDTDIDRRVLDEALDPARPRGLEAFSRVFSTRRDGVDVPPHVPGARTVSTRLAASVSTCGRSARR